MSSLKNITCLLCLFGSMVSAQMQKDYLIHKRGMLHQTVYNTGELGRKYVTSNANTELGIPSFEWPGNSATIVDAKQYTGWHNSYGGGVQIAADRVDSSKRLIAYCGGEIDAVAEYVNSFPLSQERIENFPVLANGNLNPTYNPDEAEEIIISKWATPVGVTITRTSRVWSFPDYDDFIIYEYEFENTGDLTGNPAIPPKPVKLKDLIIVFNHGMTGGKFGYNRVGGSWNNTLTDEINMYARWDRQRWLFYGNHRTGNPEPTYLSEWATTGKNGGGLLSPQSPGMMALYVDTVHLARRGDGTRVVFSALSDSVAWDINGHIKQPYYLRLETSQHRTDKVWPNVLDISLPQKTGLFKTVSLYGQDWIGRSNFNWRQGMRIGYTYGFGPYHLMPGQKVRIAWAEVCGYGSARKEDTDAGVKDIGGSNGATPPDVEAGDANYAFNIVPNYWQPKTRIQLNPTGTSTGTTVFGSDYLSKYSLPDFVNSNVVTIREVADRAIQAYTGDTLINHNTVQYWPDTKNERGSYRIPIPVPAPALTLENTLVGESKIIWGPQVESFTTPRLQGTFDHYEVYKSSHPLGPWIKLATIAKGDPQYIVGGKYQFIDKNVRIGDNIYYSVLSVDNKGNKSGRTNMTLHAASIGATATLQQVFVAPNPFIVKSGYPGSTPDGDINNQLRFYNLSKTCTIRVYSYSGQLIQTIAHDADEIQHPYFQITRNNQLIASGVYFYVVDAPDGTRVHGKFVIIN